MDFPARSIPQDQLPHPIQQFQATHPNGMPYCWPGFGWEGYSVDCTISVDAPDAMRWCHENGLIDHATRDFFNRPIRQLCQPRAPKCAKVLKELGYPL